MLRNNLDLNECVCVCVCVMFEPVVCLVRGHGQTRTDDSVPFFGS